MAIQFEKPPLGVEPDYIAAWKRIGELAAGITRQYESKNGDTGLVKKWAKEIKIQCLIIEYSGKEYPDTDL